MAPGPTIPVADHHKHLASAAAVQLLDETPVEAEELIAELDLAGIQRAVVLSVAYWFGSPRLGPVENEYAMVRAENDWIAQQAARFPDRLVAFCSFNPLRDYALAELDRCAKDPQFRGLKLHLGSSPVDVRSPEHVERMRQIFRAANERRLPVVAHLWTGVEFEREGGQHAEAFLNEILPVAPDIPIQIAHMAGGGRSTDPALKVFAEAIAAGDPRTNNLYFDVATLTAGQSEEGLERDVMRMRQIGLDRILWGSDLANFKGRNLPAKEAWDAFRTRVSLTEAELRVIASNVAPYLH